MKIGVTELIVVFIVALFVIGPDKLPSYAKKLGEALAQFRKYSQEATKDIKESIVEPLEEAQRPLREAVEPLQELNREIRGNAKEVKDSFAGIGKPKKVPKESKESTEHKDSEEPTDSKVSKEKDLDFEEDTENAPVSDVTEAVLEKSGEESAEAGDSCEINVKEEPV